MAGTMSLDIVTAERVVFNEDVTMVIAPGAAGELGILPTHIPLLTTLKPGILRVKHAGSEETILAIGGGFMEVRPDRVTVLAVSAEHAEEIDEARVADARRHAQEALAGRGEISQSEAQSALLRAEARQRAVEMRNAARTRRG